MHTLVAPGWAVVMALRVKPLPHPSLPPTKDVVQSKKEKKVFKAKYRPVQALSRREKKTNMFRPNSIQVRKPAFIRHVGASAVA